MLSDRFSMEERILPCGGCVVRNIASCRIVLCGKSQVAVACLLSHSSNDHFSSSQARVRCTSSSSHHIFMQCHRHTRVHQYDRDMFLFMSSSLTRLHTLEMLTLVGLASGPEGGWLCSCGDLRSAYTSVRAEDAQTTLSHPRHHPSSTSLTRHHVLPSLPSHHCLSLGKKLRPERAQGKEGARREIAP
jgi:hypothetical protein